MEQMRLIQNKKGPLLVGRAGLKDANELTD